MEQNSVSQQAMTNQRLRQQQQQLLLTQQTGGNIEHYQFWIIDALYIG